MFADPLGMNSNVWGSDVRENFGGVQAAPPSAAARFAETGFRQNHHPGSTRASPPYSGYGEFPGTNKVGSAIHRTWLGPGMGSGRSPFRTCFPDAHRHLAHPPPGVATALWGQHPSGKGLGGGQQPLYGPQHGAHHEGIQAAYGTPNSFRTTLAYADWDPRPRQAPLFARSQVIPAAKLPQPIVVPNTPGHWSGMEGFASGFASGFGSGSGYSPFTLILLFIIALLIVFLAGFGIGKSMANGSGSLVNRWFGSTGDPMR